MPRKPRKNRNSSGEPEERRVRRARIMARKLRGAALNSARSLVEIGKEERAMAQELGKLRDELKKISGKSGPTAEQMQISKIREISGMVSRLLGRSDAISIKLKPLGEWLKALHESGQYAEKHAGTEASFLRISAQLISLRAAAKSLQDVCQKRIEPHRGGWN